VSAALFLMLCPCLFLSIRALRRWLKVGREASSATRVFKYRKTLSAESRKRREKILEQRAKAYGALAYLPRIGAVWPGRPNYPRYDFVCHEPWKTTRIDEEISVTRETFQIFIVANSFRDRGYAMLVDEEDREFGLDALCREVDKVYRPYY
jgi:hypothetical protein